MCSHVPQCPPAYAPDHGAAHVVAACYEQGWSLLCNGVVRFTDNGVLLPNGRAIAPPAPREGRAIAPPAQRDGREPAAALVRI